MADRSRHPGLAKAKYQAVIGLRASTFWQSSDYCWKEVFEHADVMSEGATRDEDNGPTYYGTTSILLRKLPRSSGQGKNDQQQIVRLLASDPHARVRATRIACLEAQQRAKHPLGCIHAELHVSSDPSGARIDVDVEAQVYEEPSLKKTRAATTESRPKARRHS